MDGTPATYYIDAAGGTCTRETTQKKRPSARLISDNPPHDGIATNVTLHGKVHRQQWGLKDIFALEGSDQQRKIRLTPCEFKP